MLNISLELRCPDALHGKHRPPDSTSNPSHASPRKHAKDKEAAFANSERQKRPAEFAATDPRAAEPGYDDGLRSRPAQSQQFGLSTADFAKAFLTRNSKKAKHSSALLRASLRLGVHGSTRHISTPRDGATRAVDTPGKAAEDDQSGGRRISTAAHAGNARGGGVSLGELKSDSQSAELLARREPKVDNIKASNALRKGRPGESAEAVLHKKGSDAFAALCDLMRQPPPSLEVPRAACHARRDA